MILDNGPREVPPLDLLTGLTGIGCTLRVLPTLYRQKSLLPCGGSHHSLPSVTGNTDTVFPCRCTGTRVALKTILPLASPRGGGLTSEVLMGDGGCISRIPDYERLRCLRELCLRIGSVNAQCDAIVVPPKSYRRLSWRSDAVV